MAKEEHDVPQEDVKGTSLYTRNKSFAGLSLPDEQKRYVPMDGPTAGPMDQRTNTPFHRVVAHDQKLVALRHHKVSRYLALLL